MAADSFGFFTNLMFPTMSLLKMKKIRLFYWTMPDHEIEEYNTDSQCRSR